MARTLRELRKDVKRQVLPRTVPPIAAPTLRALYRTLRIERVGFETMRARWAAGEPMIFAFWHGRLLGLPPAHEGSHGLTVVISQHGDGEVIAETVGRLAIASARGSTSRGGIAAARRCLQALRRRSDVGITPDGPRGPRYTVGEGIVELARMGRVPIIPITFGAKRAMRFDSWDRFVIPLPFSPCVFLAGEAIEVPPRADAETIAALRTELEERLRALTDRADAWFAEPDRERHRSTRLTSPGR